MDVCHVRETEEALEEGNEREREVGSYFRSVSLSVTVLMRLRSVSVSFSPARAYI